MADVIPSDRTRTSADTAAPAEVTRTRTIDDLVEDVGLLRTRTRLLSDDVARTDQQVTEIHHRAFRQQLDTRARQLAKKVAGDLLALLADDGFAWRDIATLVGVSVPAVRRWRLGEPPTGEHLLAIARLVALVETLQIDHLISDVASWMEMPLSQDAPVTAIDLAATGRYEDVLDLAANHLTAEQVLEHWQPDWRDRYRSDFEIFEAPDGEAGIRPISRQGLLEPRDL
jgi:transcriptional regulator with XRE-family HTH domain